MDRKDIIEVYLDKLYEWGIPIDFEDGSTAPFTSLVLEEVCSQL